MDDHMGFDRIQFVRPIQGQQTDFRIVRKGLQGDGLKNFPFSPISRIIGFLHHDDSLSSFKVADT